MDYTTQQTLKVNMKSKFIFQFFLISLLLLLSSFNLFSYQEKDSCHKAKNLIEVNLWSFIPTDNVTFYNIQYVRKISCKNSIGLDLKLPVSSNIDGYGIGLEYRHYFFKTALKGLYFNPGLSRIELAGKNESGDLEEIELYGFNFLLGYTIILGKHFTFDVGGGITYNTGPSLQDKELTEGQSNTLPNFRFSLGWAF